MKQDTIVQIDETPFIRDNGNDCDTLLKYVQIIGIMSCIIGLFYGIVQREMHQTKTIDSEMDTQIAEYALIGAIIGMIVGYIIGLIRVVCK